MTKTCSLKKSESVKDHSKQSANKVDESYVVKKLADIELNVCSRKEIEPKAWLLNSGCTAHLCGN